MKGKPIKKKPSGYYWKERKRLEKKYRCKIDYKARTISLKWQIAARDNNEDLYKFAAMYKHQIQTML